MVKNTFIATMAILSLNVLAENGYWDSREVCDYEQVVIATPITQCYYFGSLNIPSRYLNKTASIYHTVYHSTSVTLDNHVQCASVLVTNSNRLVNLLDGEAEWVFYAGPIGLSSQAFTTKQTSSLQVVPGSCRTEEVWIPLCPTCEIP